MRMGGERGITIIMVAWKRTLAVRATIQRHLAQEVQLDHFVYVIIRCLSPSPVGACPSASSSFSS